MRTKSTVSLSAAQTSDLPSGRLLGYARVSTADQSLQMQVDYLTRAGVHPDDIYSETVSGVAKRRRALDGVLAMARRGDMLVVWKLDRVGRSLLDLLRRMDDMERRGIGFKSITEGIDTTTPGGRLIFHVMGALAQFERDLVVERTRAGVRAHIARGGRVGQPQKLTPAQKREAKQMLRSGQSRREVAEHFGVHPQTIYNRVVKKTPKAEP